MKKRPFISFILLLTFWIVISGVLDLQHIIVGIFLTMLILWFWKGFNPKLPSGLSFSEILVFGRCVIMLVGYVVKSNIEIIKRLLFSSQSLNPVFLQMDLNVKTEWGRVFLANCITITPGTITVDFDPETSLFTIHALTRETAENLHNWNMITEIRNLEKLVQRRKTHAVDTSRVHDSDTISSI